MTTLATTPPPAPPAAPTAPAVPPADRAAIFARFDAAYDASWTAEAGQFWADRYGPGMRAYANLVLARNRRVLALAPGGEALLDVGSGYGDLLYALRDRYRVLRGVDPSARGCALATYNLASRGVANDFAFTPGLAEDLPFPDASFDTALCLDTYEHIEPASRPAALAEMRRVLRPGGRLILVTPSRRTLLALALLDNLLTLRGQLIMRRRHGHAVRLWGLPAKDYCESFCTPRELLRDLRRAGLRVERFERCSFYPAPERGGWLHGLIGHLPAGHPRLERAVRAVEAIERLGVLNQKMLVVAGKEVP